MTSFVVTDPRLAEWTTGEPDPAHPVGAVAPLHQRVRLQLRGVRVFVSLLRIALSVVR